MKAASAQAQTALAALDEQGIGIPDKPASTLPDLPEDITVMGDAELMTLYSEMVMWVNYIGTQLAAATVDEEAAKSHLEKLRAIGAVKNKTEKTVTAAKARVYEDDEFNAASTAHLTAYAYRKLLESRHNAADRNSQVLSRELTRRTARSDRENRNSRWNP
jgi:hypothetical protein